MTNATATFTNNHPHGAKRMARLAAVQALYQIALTDADVAKVMAYVLENPSACLVDGGDVGAVALDAPMFSGIVQGVMSAPADIDAMVAGVFEKGPLERMEPLLRAIMRAGAYELHHNANIATGVIINDYVDVAHAYFNDKEPGLINAMLDKLAKTLRSV